MDMSDMPVNISDHEGRLRDLNEIVHALKIKYGNFDTRSSSDYTLYLSGQRDALKAIIEYLDDL